MKSYKSIALMAAVGIVTAIISTNQSLAFDFWRNPNTRPQNANQVNPTITVPAVTTPNLAAEFDFCTASKNYYEKLKTKYDQTLKDCAFMLQTWGVYQISTNKCSSIPAVTLPTKEELMTKTQTCFWALGVPKYGEISFGDMSRLLGEIAPDSSKPVPDDNGDISNYAGKSNFPMTEPLAVGAGLARLHNKLDTAKHGTCAACKDSLGSEAAGGATDWKAICGQ